MLHPKLNCVCILCFKSVAPSVCLVEIPFVAFFGPDIKTEMGVVTYMYLKHFPDNIDSKYIWVHGCNSLGSSVFTEIPFLAFLVLHRERRCDQVGPSPCYSQREVYMHTNFRYVAPRGFLEINEIV